jgi:hypothetical protein
MKSMGEDKVSAEVKPVEKKSVAVELPKAPVKEAVAVQEEVVEEEKPVKKFEGKGLAGVVKKLSEEKLEDKAKRITDKLEKNPDKKDKVVEKEKKPAKKTEKKVEKAEKTPTKKTTKK